MPNWEHTTLSFLDVTDEEFRAIVEQYCHKYVDVDDWCLDFEKLIPMPETVYRGDLSTEDRREKYPGDLNWHDWSINHWGTKWNAHDGWVDFKTHQMGFDTAWCYAEPPIKVLAERTNARIDVYSINEDFMCGSIWQSFYPASPEQDARVEEGMLEYGTDEFYKAARNRGRLIVD